MLLDSQNIARNNGLSNFKLRLLAVLVEEKKGLVYQ